MILKTYIFSQVAGLYQQYTTDISEAFLREICKKCSASDQIAIHRDGNLMYYAYIHKSSSSEIYGLCIVCGEICLDVDELYKIFQQSIETAAHKGVIFRYADNGRITKNVDTFASEAADVDNVFRELKEILDDKPSLWKELPPEDLSIPLDSLIRLSFSEDKADKIVDAIIHYHNVIVTLEPTVPSSFSSIVRSKNDEITALKEEKQKLIGENNKIKRQKKQFQTVVILFLVLIGCGIWLLSLNDNLNLTKGKLDAANDSINSQIKLIEKQKNTITKKNDKIDSLSSDIFRLKSSIENEQEKRENAEQELEQLKSSIRSSIPLIITSIDVANTDANDNIITEYGYNIYSNSSMYLSPRIRYTGIREGESVTLYIKLYNSNGSLSTGSSSPSGYSYSKSISISSGFGNTAYLGGWGSKTRGHWPKGSYRFEIWHGNMCLKAKTFTLY